QWPVVEGASDLDKSVTYGARAMGAARSRDLEQARKEVAQVEPLREKLEPGKKKDEGEYEGVSEDLTIAQAWLAHAEGHDDEALRLLHRIADKEEGEAEASQGVPAHEMIADILLESKHPEQALPEYELSLKNDPGRFDSLYGAAHAAAAAGKNDKAKEYYAQVVKNCEGSASERGELKQAREQAVIQTAAQKSAPR